MRFKSCLLFALLTGSFVAAVKRFDDQFGVQPPESRSSILSTLNRHSSIGKTLKSLCGTTCRIDLGHRRVPQTRRYW